MKTGADPTRWVLYYMDIFEHEARPFPEATGTGLQKGFSLLWKKTLMESITDTGSAAFARFGLNWQNEPGVAVIAIKVEPGKNAGLVKLRRWLDDQLLENLAGFHLQAFLRGNHGSKESGSEESELIIQLAEKTDSKEDFSASMHAAFTGTCHEDGQAPVLLRFIAHVEAYWQARALPVEKNKLFLTPRFKAGLFIARTGRSIGFLFPYTDYFFFHWEPPLWTKEDLYRSHQNAREYVHALYKTPRLLRYRVPNIITVLAATEDFSGELATLAKTDKSPLTGGEKNSIFLINVSTKRLIGEDLKLIRGIYHRTNPFNRVSATIHELVDTFL